MIDSKDSSLGQLYEYALRLLLLIWGFSSETMPLKVCRKEFSSLGDLTTDQSALIIARHGLHSLPLSPGNRSGRL